MDRDPQDSGHRHLASIPLPSTRLVLRAHSVVSSVRTANERLLGTSALWATQDVQTHHPDMHDMSDTSVSPGSKHSRVAYVRHRHRTNLAFRYECRSHSRRM